MPHPQFTPSLTETDYIAVPLFRQKGKSVSAWTLIDLDSFVSRDLTHPPINYEEQPERLGNARSLLSAVVEQFDRWKAGFSYDGDAYEIHLQIDDWLHNR